LKNTGALAGAEVAQLYIGEKEPKVDRPAKELKAFAKVKLNPGEMKKVTLTISKNALAYFDGQMQSWNVENGVYYFLVGGSSRDLKLKTEVDVK
jgi:beta-glucosidase